MEQLAGARELQKRKVTLTSLGLRQRDVQPSCRSALACLGVVGCRHRIAGRDWIAESLTGIYGCNGMQIWRDFLGEEYEHALQFIIEAKSRFQGAYSEWLGLQDSFNDIVIRQFFDFLKNKGLGGHSKILDKNGKLVKYGQLIATGDPFDTNYPVAAKALRALHQRRNKLPGSHPYDEKGGAKNKWLTKRERDSLVPKAKNGLNIIASVVEKNI